MTWLDLQEHTTMVADVLSASCHIRGDSNWVPAVVRNTDGFEHDPSILCWIIGAKYVEQFAHTVPIDWEKLAVMFYARIMCYPYLRPATASITILLMWNGSTIYLYVLELELVSP